jgi:hypothetical protein
MGQRADYDPESYEPITYPQSLREETKTEISEKFIDGMRNRMMVSYYKYGPVAKGFPERVNALESLQGRINKYKETGNAEWLIDAANFAMIEFMHPSRDAHFVATSSDESIGRARNDVGEVHDPNWIPDPALDNLKRKFERGD